MENFINFFQKSFKISQKYYPKRFYKFYKKFFEVIGGDKKVSSHMQGFGLG